MYSVFYQDAVQSFEIKSFGTLEEALDYCREETNESRYAGVGIPDGPDAGQVFSLSVFYSESDPATDNPIFQTPFCYK